MTKRYWSHSITSRLVLRGAARTGCPSGQGCSRDCLIGYAVAYRSAKKMSRSASARVSGSSGGRWHEGESEPVQREGDVYDDDPGGAAVLLAPLLDPQAEVRELVTFVYEQPERLDDALALVRERGID